ncbi:YhcN/YlaJ family sporulation lipoprotein [Falsibacillus pallidus]|uniref:YhcN/YlaJ family sporulation lipoprotein n=1 Tax=Falsibacillus pallidus TaxID=493781 RepID=A0A370GVP3_9BACI|nr:YhcN/YlaJ family sporulation lipoprotein [Falsibacillus pallidus]RDI45993.1 YhcN/YlaJ family sporulation lipoprotein [Falsibacillus pallidus]
MKIVKVVLAASLLAVPLTACASKNNVNDEKGTKFQNVRYTPGTVNDNNNMDMNDNNMNNNVGDNNYSVANDVADQVNKIDNVSNANVLVTDHTAYVAAKLDTNKEGTNTKDMEKKISDKVKEADKSIDNVYVSTNPDFADRLKGYADKIQAGKPVVGLGDEIAEMLRRVFPNQR